MNQENRMQAVVPHFIASDVQQQICLGKLHVFSTFDVKDYKTDEIYKCINYDKFICVTRETKIEQIPELDDSIKQNAFDFYPLHQMTNIANMNIFLTGNDLNMFSVCCLLKHTAGTKFLTFHFRYYRGVRP